MFRYLSQDAPASLVVFLVALPLCLGIALASGAPPLSGLIAGIVGGFIVGLISGSQLGVSGPAAGLAVIVFNGIQEMPTFEIFLLAVFIGGFIQLLLGLIKAGIIGFYFPSSVIQGMLAAIGIIIFLKQIPHAVGYDFEPEGSLEFAQDASHNTFSDLLLMLDFIQPVAVSHCVCRLVFSDFVGAAFHEGDGLDALFAWLAACCDFWRFDSCLYTEQLHWFEPRSLGANPTIDQRIERYDRHT